MAAARLRPDNRAVLVYEPLTSGEAAGPGGGSAGQEDEREEAGQ